MKKQSTKVFALSISFVLILIQSFNAFAQTKNRYILSPVQQIQADYDLANTIKQRTNRSSKGLSEVRNADGGVTLDLDGRFQNLMLAKLNSHGEPISACVASLPEANSFFGRNLETGQILPFELFATDEISQTAEDHGMSKQEYLFYMNLIKEAGEQRLLNPNSATITIVNNDGVGEGLNNTTPANPEGGNNGMTRGEQRLNLFKFAADIWGAFLDSSVEIKVRAKFDELTCTSNSATLGGAGTTTIHADFANARLPNTWYHQALANKQSGSDRSASEDISATFNSKIDGRADCIGGARFYLGFNNSSPSGTINLLVTVLHEMGHGLGFQNFVDEADGIFIQGRPDVFTTYMFDMVVNKYWNDMTPEERVQSAINTNNVFWDGPSIKLASDFLESGRDPATGRVELFVPSPVESGSSVSHFSDRNFPNLLMEPRISRGLPLDLDLTKQQMRDIGWYRDTTSDLIPDTITTVTPSGGSVLVGSQVTVTWVNTGGFNKNVTIELSTDGGTTYPIKIAENIANNGTYTFTVPNNSTGQAKIRVREYNFAEPVGVSANNFTIGTSTTSRSKTKFDFDGDGKTDTSIFRSDVGQWWYRQSSSGQTGVTTFGTSSDKLVPADYSGDGKTDIAFWRPATGEWFVLRSDDFNFYALPFGQAGDIPAPGDYDGDGMADVAVYRPSQGVWYIRQSSGGINIVQFGLPEDKPTIADYDGDGKDDIAIYRPSVSQWWQVKSTGGVGAVQFGASGDKTQVGDYTGDGKADLAFFRPANGFWYILKSDDSNFFAFPFGAGTDVPAAGDYDGDGKWDAAVFRRSNGIWYINGTQSGVQFIQFGATNDVILPNVYSAQ